jgi:hypothetical protein
MHVSVLAFGFFFFFFSFFSFSQLIAWLFFSPFKDILNEPNQKLFTHCAYVNPQGGAQCTYPIIVGQNPPYCNGHIDLVIPKEAKPSKKRKGPDDDKGPIAEPKKNKVQQPPSPVAVAAAAPPPPLLSAPVVPAAPSVPVAPSVPALPPLAALPPIPSSSFHSLNNIVLAQGPFQPIRAPAPTPATTGIPTALFRTSGFPRDDGFFKVAVPPILAPPVALQPHQYHHQAFPLAPPAPPPPTATTAPLVPPTPMPPSSASVTTDQTHS